MTPLKYKTCGECHAVVSTLALDGVLCGLTCRLTRCPYPPLTWGFDSTRRADPPTPEGGGDGDQHGEGAGGVGGDPGPDALGRV